MTPSLLTIANVLSEIESSHNPRALRFEPGEFQLIPNHGIIDRIAQCNICNSTTARIIYSMSWGYYQIMGFNLYDDVMQYDKDVITFCSTDSGLQQLYLSRFLSSIGYPDGPDFDIPSDLLEFATRYNGPENPDSYRRAMLAAYNRKAE